MSTAAIVYSPGRLAWWTSLGEHGESSTFSQLYMESHIRSAVVLLPRRSSFLKTSELPNVKGSDLDQLVSAKTASMFPGPSQSYSFANRAEGRAANGRKLLVVAAAKSETLRTLSKEADEAKIKIISVLPSAVSSWIAASERKMPDCLVLSRQGADTCFDVISGGELVYSRFSLVESEQELSEEIATTGRLAGVSTVPGLALGQMSYEGFVHDPREPAEFALDLSAIPRSQLSLELTEKRQARERKRTIIAVELACGAVCSSLVLWGITVNRHLQLVQRSEAKASIERALDRGETAKFRAATSAATKLNQSAHLLNLAFDPPQTFSDIISVLGSETTPDLWLTGLSMQRGAYLSLRGEARTQKDISTYIGKLRSEPRFRDVQLKFSTRGSRNNLPIYQFSISLWAIGNLPFTQHVEAPLP